MENPNQIKMPSDMLTDIIQLQRVGMACAVCTELAEAAKSLMAEHFAAGRGKLAKQKRTDYLALLGQVDKWRKDYNELRTKLLEGRRGLFPMDTPTNDHYWLIHNDTQFHKLIS